VESCLQQAGTNLFPPDLIILDLLMPREEPTANFRKLRERFGLVPILLCTGQADPNPAAELSGQRTSLLRKPFRMKELWHAVQNALQMPGETSGTSTLF
jgi:CheY-like chemotaxis protein